MDTDSMVSDIIDSDKMDGDKVGDRIDGDNDENETNDELDSTPKVTDFVFLCKFQWTLAKCWHPGFLGNFQFPWQGKAEERTLWAEMDLVVF